VRRLVDVLGTRCVGVAPPIAAHSPAADVDDLLAFLKASSVDGIVPVGGSSVADAGRLPR
jgi:alcohol dehydrogenase class IV